MPGGSKRIKRRDITKRIIGGLLMFGLLVGTLISVDLEIFIDFPSLFIVVIGAIGYGLASDNGQSWAKNFSDGAVRFGWVGTIIGCLMIGHNVTADFFTEIGPAVSVAILTVLYGYMLKALLTTFE